MSEPSQAAALQTIRALRSIILNGNQAEWITERTAQSWLNELGVVEHRLDQAEAVEAERDAAATTINAVHAIVEKWGGEPTSPDRFLANAILALVRPAAPPQHDDNTTTKGQ